MPSFDVVSDVEIYEVTNAVENANRAIKQRYDLKGTDSSVRLENDKVVVISESDFQVDQVASILYNELARRSIDIKSLDVGAIKPNGKVVEKEMSLKQGIDKETAKKIVKQIKAEKFKVQAAIQQDQVRVTGKKRDDLQTVISYLKKSDFDIPLQFKNFKD
ncbi:MAG: YajQ family cyclic di-GMP-binding protein [Gammaproteobacteria bacterium]|nr:YajQ family cyclic di-GMP-binding protein [Gammaproteobacteria bacterium]